MTLDYILWLTVLTESSAHKWKNRALLSRKGLNTFPTLKALCSWLSPAERLPPCCQYTPPSEQRPSRLRSPNYPTSHPENWWPGALLSNSFRSPDSCRQTGMSAGRDKGRFRWSPTNKILICKNRAPICASYTQGKVPSLSFNTDDQMYALERFATSERISYCLCFRKTLYNCILHNRSVKINSLSLYLMAQLVCTFTSFTMPSIRSPRQVF